MGLSFCFGSGSSRTCRRSAAVAEAHFGDPISSYVSVEGRDLFVGTSSGRIALFDMRMAAAVWDATTPAEPRDVQNTVCELNDIDAWSTCGIRALQRVEGDMIAVVGDKGLKRWPAANHEPLKKGETPAMMQIPFPGRQRTGGQGHSLLSGSTCMILRQGSPSYVYDAASYSFGCCSNLVLPWSSLPIHMGASSVVFRELAGDSAASADCIVDAGGWGQGKLWDFSLWVCEYSDWGSAASQNQPSDMFSDAVSLDFEVKALKRVRSRWGRCASAVAQSSSPPALLLGGNQKMGLFGAGSHVSSLPWHLQVLQICQAPPASSALAAAVVADSAESLSPRLQLWCCGSGGLTCSADIACGDGWEYYGCSCMQAQWVDGCPNLVLVGGGDGIVMVDVRVGGTV